MTEAARPFPHEPSAALAGRLREEEPAEATGDATHGRPADESGPPEPTPFAGRTSLSSLLRAAESRD